MSVVAVTMVKDERDIIGVTIPHLLRQGVDLIVAADNMSTDGTFEILHHLARVHGRIEVLRDTEPAYYQDRKMTALAAHAAAPGDWVIPFDADELWSSPDGPLATVLANLDADIALGRPFVHVPTDMDDDNDHNPVTRMGWRMDIAEHNPKVAFRWQPTARIHMGNHGVDLVGTQAEGHLDIRHFQYRTYNQVVTKVTNGARAYRASNLHDGYGSHWRNLAAMTPSELRMWWTTYTTQPGLVFDPAPFTACPSPP